jgi:probable phosphoglycerate mutase
MTARIVLVRHAEPTRWARGRAIGRTDVGLSRAGERQAHELAARLAVADRVDRVVTSPASRARRTAEPIARVCDAPITIEPDLREIDFGDVDGRTFGQIERDHPALFAAWMRAPTEVEFPGGEPWPALRDRVDAALERVATEGDGRTTVVTAHLGPVLATLARVLALPERELFGLAVPHAAALTLELRGDGWTLLPSRTVGAA